tara:strand:- start:4303 stop:4461 length:159 start_codon:yes stop_codon:yes gene_type:complete
MMDILAAANVEYNDFFTADWLVFGVIGGIIWAAKDNFNFGCFKDEDDEHMFH